jgi:hypothetical protein
MDPRDTEKAREETLERLLARSLRQTLGARGAECPAPEILAAYFDHALGPTEASEWEAHFSRCAHCQQVLAALLTSEPEPMAVEEHEPVATLAVMAELPATPLRKAEPAAPTAPARPGKKKWGPGRYLSWNWLAPLAAAAVAAAFWLIIRPASESPVRVAQESPAPSGEMARKAPAPPPNASVQNGALPAPSASRKRRVQAPTSSLGAVTETQPSQRAKVASGPPRLGTKPSLADATGREGAQAQATPSQINGIGAAPAAARPEEKELTEQERAAQKKEAARGFIAGAAESKSGALRDEADKKAAGELANAPPRAGAPGAAEQRSQAGTVIVSSAANYKLAPAVIASARGWVMWRVGTQGSIERSLNAGRTWQAQASDVDADLVAGSAPSDTVCWVVGRAGTILRTTDGEHWKKIPSPAMLDWTSVKAQDALRAEVSAGRKQIYFTTDGGETWQGASPAK